MKCVLIILFTVVVWTPCLCALVLPLDNRAGNKLTEGKRMYLAIVSI